MYTCLESLKLLGILIILFASNQSKQWIPTENLIFCCNDTQYFEKQSKKAFKNHTFILCLQENWYTWSSERTALC